MLNSGDIIMLCRPARWKNAGADDAIEIPAGAVLRLESKRPEGWMAYVLMTRETVFLFSRYLEHVERVELGRETVIRHAGGVRVDCAQCGAERGCLDARYFHVNRAGGWEVLCPDCAAILALLQCWQVPRGSVFCTGSRPRNTGTQENTRLDAMEPTTADAMSV